MRLKIQVIIHNGYVHAINSNFPSEAAEVLILSTGECTNDVPTPLLYGATIDGEYHRCVGIVEPVGRSLYVDSPFQYGLAACPNCGSLDEDNSRTWGSFDHDGSTIFQSVSCGDCDETWTDAYELNRVLSNNDRVDYHFDVDDGLVNQEEGEEPEGPELWEPESPWSDHIDYPVSDWVEEAVNNTSRLSYIDWVNHKIEDDYEDSKCDPA